MMCSSLHKNDALFKFLCQYCDTPKSLMHSTLKYETKFNIHMGSHSSIDALRRKKDLRKVVSKCQNLKPLLFDLP